MEKKYDISIHFQTKTNKVSEINKKISDYLDSENYKKYSIFGERESEVIKGTVNIKYTEPRTTLHHCFLRQQELSKLNLPKEKVALIEETFDFIGSLSEDIIQWKGASTYEDALCWDRRYMLENIKKCNGVSIFIGEIIDGVKDEYDIALELNLDIIAIP